MADYVHPADVTGTATNQEITDGVNRAIETLGLNEFVLRLAVDFKNQHWHDWRIYALTLYKIALENKKESEQKP